MKEKNIYLTEIQLFDWPKSFIITSFQFLEKSERKTALLWFRTRTNFWMLESLWEWKLQAQDSFNHSFPRKASASAIAVEVAETMWRFKTESFSSCYTDSTPMAIPEFSNLLFQGSFHFLCRVTPQSTIFTGSKHRWWVSSLSTF